MPVENTTSRGLVRPSRLVPKEYEPRRRPGIAFLITGEEQRKPVAASLAQPSHASAVSCLSQPSGFVEASVVPFIGARIRKGEGGATSTELGIGVRLPDKGSHIFFGVQRPHDLIRAWRAAQLLHAVGHIGEDTLKGVWHAAGRDDRGVNQPSARAIAGGIGSAQFFRARERVLGMTPSLAEMDVMFYQLGLTGVRVNRSEWNREVTRGSSTRRAIGDRAAINNLYVQNGTNANQFDRNEHAYRAAGQPRIRF
jgi:hypothetical protein